MNLRLELPTCPICNSLVGRYEQICPLGNAQPIKQKITFFCNHEVVREARADFKDVTKNYGAWSTWKCMHQCDKATEIALKLLEKTNEEA